MDRMPSHLISAWNCLALYLEVDVCRGKARFPSGFETRPATVAPAGKQPERLMEVTK